MESWDGMERRKMTRRTNGDRRGDQCPLHELIWEHHDQDRKENRALMNQEIMELRKISSSMTPWKVFVLSMLIILGAIGWLGKRVDDGQTMHTKEIQSSINQLSEDLNKKIESFHPEIKK